VSRDPAAALDSAQRRALRTVLELLAAERASVSSVTTPPDAWRTHVLDSLTGLELDELSAAGKIADIGSGAGFPGLVLAVALPAAELDLIESVGRKCAFVERAAEAAGIGNATVLNARSEELAAGPARDTYDAATARAVGRLSSLAELAVPLLREDGVLVAWKGRRDREEEEQMDRASDQLAMRVERVLDVGGRGGSRHRHLYLLRKTGPTPPGLPRRPGMAKKRPRG
jgi:16S rRNA (guanine527-N7)-methyltransferase